MVNESEIVFRVFMLLGFGALVFGGLLAAIMLPNTRRVPYQDPAARILFDKTEPPF